jgi:molybdopterin biosynthesis enzyme
MKQIRTVDGVGTVLAHDMTRIVPGVYKGPQFKKGHIVREEDIPMLLSMGKESLYVWEMEEGTVHEDDAAKELCRLAASGSPYIRATEPSEGKIELFAAADGLFCLDAEALAKVNSDPEIAIASRRGGAPVRKGDKLASMRVIPLAIRSEKLDRAFEASGGGPLLSVVPYQEKSYAFVVTGSEIASGRIEDKFTSVLRKKMDFFGAKERGRALAGDDPKAITQAICGFLEEGCDIVFATGGMSVDPDDKTPLAIKNTGAKIVRYGAPVSPGAMFLLAYTSSAQAVIGLPGCVMHAERTIFDAVLPRIVAGMEVTAEAIARLGSGGLCLECETCIYPVCSFAAGA